MNKISLIQVRPPKDFGPKAQNLEGVRTSLRICGMEIISSKNREKIPRSNFRQKCPKLFPREMTSKEITQKKSQKNTPF